MAKGTGQANARAKPAAAFSGGRSGARRAPDASTAPIHTLESYLRDRDTPLTFVEIARLRERAASHLLADPRLADRLACAVARSARSGATAPDVLAVVWRMRAEADVYLGRLGQAARAYERACDASRRARRDDLLAEILVGRIGVLTALGETGQISTLVAHARRLLRRAGNDAYVAKLEMNLGSAAFHRADFESARACYVRAAAAFPRPREGATWLGLQCNRGIAATELGRIAEARRCFEVVIAEGEAGGQAHLVAHAWMNRAFLDAHTGDYRTALNLLDRASQGFVDLGARDLIATTQLAYAEFALDLNLVDEATERAAAAVPLFEAEGKTIDAHLARFVLARALVRHRRFEEAESELRRVEAFFRAQRARPRLASASLERARLELMRGRPGRAVPYARRALRSLEGLGLESPRLRARCVLLEVALAREDRAEVRKIIAATEPEVDRSWTRDQHRFWTLAGRAALREGDLRLALPRLLRARRQLRRERRLTPGAAIRAAALPEHLGLYRELCRAELERPRPRGRRILQWIDEAYGASLREHRTLVGGKGHRKVRAARLRLGRLTSRLDALSTTAAHSDASTVELRREARTLEATLLRELQRWESDGATIPSATRCALAAGESLVELVPFDHDVLALVVRRGGVTARVLDGAVAPLREVLARFRHQIDSMAVLGPYAQPSRGFVTRVFESLECEFHRILLAPLDVLLPRRGRLTLVPHGFLHAVPFETLRDAHGPLDDRYLVVRQDSAFVGSDLRSNEANRARSAKPMGRATVAAVEEGGPKHALLEATEVQKRFEAAGWTTRRRTQPTRQQILRDLRYSRVVHLAAHAVFRADNPEFSRIQLSDGPLFASDLRARRNDADMVVLSGCATARVSGREEQDLMGLAHGILATGCRTVVASLWPVDDAATRAFFSRFYAAYLEGEGRDAPAARREAAQGIRREGGAAFHFGAFVVLRSGRPAPP